jgi:hyperosmotically inducible periplasmic protein
VSAIHVFVGEQSSAGRILTLPPVPLHVAGGHHYQYSSKELTVNTRISLAAALTAVALLTVSGCAVTRGQESVGAYIDDATITTQVKSRFVENKQVDAASIKVETLNGTVMLSGFAKNTTERTTAEAIARNVNGVKSVKNEIAVRP